MIEGRSWKGWLIALFVVSVGAVSLRMARDDAQRERRMRPSAKPISKEMAKTLSEATIADGRYHSHFFRFSFPIPEGWSFMTQQMINEVEQKRAASLELIPGSEEWPRQTNAYTRTIFVLRSEQDLDKPASALAFAVEATIPNTSLEDYAQHLMSIYCAGENLVPVTEPNDLEIRGRKFKVVEVRPSHMEGPIISYVTIHGSYVLIFATTASNPEAAQQLMDLISAIEFPDAP